MVMPCQLRKLLLEAAAKLIRKNGFGGLRTMEVAKLAGVSRGALLHHFPSKHALVVEVLTYVNEMNFAQSTRRARLARSSGDPIGEIIEDAKDYFLGDHFFIGLAIAMSDESTRRLRRETSELTRQTRFSIEAAWLDTLISSGIPKQLASDILALTLSVVRGFSVLVLAAIWTGFWFYASSKAQATFAQWREQEARLGRTYTCGSQSSGGYPFRLEVRCDDATVEMRAFQPVLVISTKSLQMVAQVYDPTLLIGEVTGPLTVTEAGAPEALVASGLPRSRTRRPTGAHC